MSTYLLLRSNKESGPYSLTELLEFGFKPYDLVWVNGKSAAWRYPGEIDELKSFAPVTEEQPYDRFYKKPEATEIENPIKKEQPFPIQKPIEMAQQVEIRQKQESNIPFLESKPKKQVYVSLPVNTPVKKVEAEQTAVPPAQPTGDVKKNIPTEYENYMPSQKGISETEKTVRLEKRFSQPLEEIKDMYVQTLVDRKKKIARNNFFKKNMKNVAIIFLILALGVLMGFAFQNFNSKKEPLATIKAQPLELPDNTKLSDQQIIAKEDSPVPKDDAKILLPATNEASKIENPKQSGNSPAERQLKNIDQKNIIETPGMKEESAQKEVVKNKEAVKNTEEVGMDEPPPSVDKDPVTGERKKIVRAEKEPGVLTEKEPIDRTEKEAGKNSIPRSNVPRNVSRENIWKLVTLKTSNYITGPFGGIKDLRLTVANNSDHPLDKVEVEVKYIGMEQQIIKTQTMVFNDIAPGGQVQSEVPRTTRGMSVECSIKKINSRESAMAKSEF